MTMLSPEEVATRKLAAEKEARLVAHYVTEIMKTHGPPPLTITESPEDFKRILTAVIRIRWSRRNRARRRFNDIRAQLIEYAEASATSMANLHSVTRNGPE